MLFFNGINTKHDNGQQYILQKSWLPCGTAFKVFDQQSFEDFIMPAYFATWKTSPFSDNAIYTSSGDYNQVVSND
jgi:hypothetical protein